MKKYSIVFLTFFLFNFSVSASHFMGGEITWRCVKGGPDVGKYIFEMKVYRDCAGIAFSQIAETITHHNYPTLGYSTPILMNFISATDISPLGSTAAGNACFDCSNGDLGSVEEYKWESDPLILSGTPPASGWHFTWGSAARNAAISNLVSPSSLAWTLRAVMYPYNHPTLGLLPADPCFDSSPAFKEKAKTIICTGYPFAYSHNASDEELDQITYSWADPLGDSFSYDPNNPNLNALPFLAPYTTTSPFPGNPSLDPSTGEIAYFSVTAGAFVTCVKVEARKCGQLVSEIYREVQVFLLDCNTLGAPTDGFNDPPIFSSPTGTQTWLVSTNSAGLNSYSTTVYAGDLVTFNIEAEDLDTYVGGVAQDITLDVSSGQFSDDYVNPLLCDNPPCATFNNGAGVVPPNIIAPSLVAGVFEWQSSCSHLDDNCTGLTNASNVFTFSIKAYDDFCPANGVGITTIKITVVPPIPDLRCVSVQDNGNIDLTWNYIDNAPLTSEPVLIWHSSSFSGPYTNIGTVAFPIETFTHIGGNGNTASQYYFLSNEQGCDATPGGLNSDTLQSIFMDITPINFGVSAIVDWNAIHDPLLATSAFNYEMYIKEGSSAFINYLTTPLKSYLYDAVECNEDLQFYVEISDANGCTSKSTIGTVNLGDTMTPITPIITDISVDSNGKSEISWIPSPGADYYIIYLNGDQGDITIDTVFGELNSSYNYISSFANQYVETFSIRAEDSCGNTKITTPYHNSIYLSFDLDECTRNLTLSWNKYNNWLSGVSYYSVVVEETDLNGIITKIDTSLVDINEYVAKNLTDQYSYNIFVVANDGDSNYSALSNQLILIPDLPKKPDYNYIEYATVNHDNGFVEVNCLVDNTAIINYYDVMRSLNYVNNFEKIAEIPFVGGTAIHYTDKFVKSNNNFYQYRIYPVDTCGIRLSVPPVDAPEFINDTSLAQTILVEIETNLDYVSSDLVNIPFNSDNWVSYPDGSGIEKQYTNTITFNEYNKWLGEVQEYSLYRSVNREPFNLIPLKTWTYPFEEFKFIDVVSSHRSGNGRFCYYIKANEGNITPYGSVAEGSYSNISCISQTPSIFIPNTFTPNGDEHNEIFRPFTNFVSDEGYSFTIYNRSGGIIFTTNDPLKGWDGNLNGNMVKDDNYIFHLQYVNGIGEITEKTDIITLVR